MKTTISVLLPVHNGMPYLPETIQSILAQSHADFECLAMDDGSSDGTTEYLKSLGDRRIKYVRLEKVGLVGALNEGLRLAQNELIARIDGDDVARPNRLEAQADFLARHPQCVLLGCDFDEIDLKGRVISSNEYNVERDPSLRLLMHFATPFLHPGVMFRRTACLAAGGYRKTHDVAEDFDLWTRLAFHGEIASLPDKLMLKRIHPAAVSIVHRTRGLTQSRTIAGDYARQVDSELSPELAGSIYWFYQTGEADQHRGRDIVAGFQRLISSACQRDPSLQDCPEWQATVAYLREKLGWLAFRRARAQLRNPWRCREWLQVANRFNPGRYSLPALVERLWNRQPRQTNAGRIVPA